MGQADTEYLIRSRSGPHGQGAAYQQTVHAFDQFPGRAFGIYERHDYMACPPTIRTKPLPEADLTASQTLGYVWAGVRPLSRRGPCRRLYPKDT